MLPGLMDLALAFVLRFGRRQCEASPVGYLRGAGFRWRRPCWTVLQLYLVAHLRSLVIRQLKSWASSK